MSEWLDICNCDFYSMKIIQTSEDRWSRETPSKSENRISSCSTVKTKTGRRELWDWWRWFVFTLTLIFDHFVQLESNNMCRDVAVWPMHSSGWTNSSPRVTVVSQHLKPVLQFSATTEHDWPLPAWNNQLIWASFVYPLFNRPTSMIGESFYPKCPSWHKVLL